MKNGGTGRLDPPERYRVAVALGDTARVEQLMRTARDLARDRDGEVLVVSVIVKPRRSPFSLFSEEVIRREFAGDRREILDRAVAMADDVPVHGRLLVSPNLSRALRRAVREFDCDALLLGWRERSRDDVVLGRTVDRVVRRAPCDVLVERIGSIADGVESVLLPAAEGPNTELAAEVARAIARANDARVDVLRVIPPDAAGPERTDAAALVEDVAADLAGVSVGTHVEAAADVPDALVAASASRDVTVLGATDRGMVRRLVVGATPERVGRDAPNTVIMTRRGRPQVGWLPWPWP